MAVTYVINFTDAGKPTFSIQSYKTDGPASPTNPALDGDALAASTSLLLYGKGHPNYGERIQENLVHMLENFSGATAPVYPTRGQVWHDTAENMLRVYNGSAWVSTNTIFAGGTAPTSPTQGQLWYDTNIADDGGQFTVSQLKVYNGATWVSVATNYVLKTGDTMSGALAMGTNKITGLGNATAATDALNMQTGDARYINISGDTMAGDLILNADPTVALGAATKQYVDTVASSLGLAAHIADTTVHLTTTQNTLLDGLAGTLTFTELNYVDGVTSPIQTQLDGKLNLTGGTMLGNLTLAGAPVNNLHAATKLYVDTAVGALPGDGNLISGSFNTDTYVLTLNTSLPSIITVNTTHEHPFLVFDSVDSSLWTYYNNLPIVGVSTVSEYFVVNGDFTTSFYAGYVFTVSGSTGNDASWTVSSSSYAVGPNETTVIVTGNITDATVDGIIVFPTPPRLSEQQGFEGLDITKAPVDDATLTGSTELIDERLILAVVTGVGGSFAIADDHTTVFVSGFIFEVAGSTGNDGNWTVTSSSYNAGTNRTTIVVTGTIASGIVDGNVIWPQVVNTRYSATHKEYVDNKTTITRAIQTGAATTTPTYTVGANNLWVFVNGVKWYLTDGYTETTSTSITWVTAPGAGDRVEFISFG